jgi:glycosyltransferase XagB
MEISAHDIATARTIAGPERCSLEMARAILERAKALDVDPFETMSVQLDMAPADIIARAAACFGFAYCADPGPFIPRGDAVPVDAIAETTSVRGHVGDTEIIFLAPGFWQVLALARQLPNADERRARICFSPQPAIRRVLVSRHTPPLLDGAIHRLSRVWRHGSAQTALNAAGRAGLVAFLAVLALWALLTPNTLQAILTPLLTLFLVTPSIFRLWAAASHRQSVPLDTQQLLPDHLLPTYSVLIPLRDEAHMVAQIVTAMRNLDYPAEKLDIKFVVEAHCKSTIAAVSEHLRDVRFDLVVVPKGGPTTKPKALNFALPLARGHHIVVFDAEDVPERDQLRKAATLFARHRDIACLQAALVIANSDTNWLTGLFAAEYAGHFGVLLPAIGRAGLPMPLGGTSNHFRRETLIKAGGWDAFNVTEDADLGIRLDRMGYRSASFAARTYEEAPSTSRAWLHQRSRWMKGWMQTLLVHNRHPVRLVRDLGWRNALAFQVFVGGMVISTALHGVFLLAVLGRIVYEVGMSGTVGLWSVAHLFVLLLGYSGAAAVSILGLVRLEQTENAKALFALPFYWLLAGLATCHACWELVVRPYHWAKTTHVGIGPRTSRARAYRPGESRSVQLKT